jgi:hypothetical protein
MAGTNYNGKLTHPNTHRGIIFEGLTYPAEQLVVEPSTEVAQFNIN